MTRETSANSAYSLYAGLRFDEQVFWFLESTVNHEKYIFEARYKPYVLNVMHHFKNSDKTQ